MARFFHTENAARKIGGEFQFAVYGIFGGCPFGVYKADIESEQDLLAELMKDPRNALSEIDEAEYEKLLKKNPRSSVLVRLPEVNHQDTLTHPAFHVAKSKGATEPQKQDEQPTTGLPSAAEAVTTGDIEVAETPKPQTRRTKKKS